MGDLLQPWHIIVLLFIFMVVPLHIALFWVVCKKAGLSPPLSLLCLIPWVGPFIVLCVLAFSGWRVVPVPQTSWPPQSPYPPAPQQAWQQPVPYPPQSPLPPQS